MKWGILMPLGLTDKGDKPPKLGYEYRIEDHYKKDVIMKEYEIWIGYCHLGQGYDPSTEPKMIGKERAINFPVACIKHELKTKLESIEKQEKTGYVDHQSMEWFYNRSTNSNSWLGKYFETKEEAQQTFNR